MNKQKGKRKSTPCPDTLKLIKQRHSFPVGPSDFVRQVLIICYIQFSLNEMDEDENINEEKENYVEKDEEKE